MKVVRLSRERSREFIRVCAVAFNFDGPTFDRMAAEIDRRFESGKESDIWAAENDDGKIIAGMRLRPYVCRLGNEWVKLCGIGAVSALPEYRRTGAIRAIFREGLAWMKDQGYTLSGLYPFSHAFYRKFGYELCRERITQTLDLEDLISAFPQPAEATEFENEPEKREEVYRLYADFAGKYDLAMRRSDEQWDRMFRGEVLKDQFYKYLLKDADGKSEAYIFFNRVKRDGMNFMDVREMVWRDPAALRELLGFIGRFYPHYKQAGVHLPGGIHLASFFPKPYDVSIQAANNYMLRVVDPVRALRALRYPEESGSFTLKITDDFFPVSSGVYHVEFVDGSAEVTKSETGPADAEMSVHTLAQLISGYSSLSQAVYREDFRLNANEPVLSKVFVRRDTYCGDSY